MRVTMSNSSNRILILDFGSQYSQIIARRVRELGIYCELLSCDLTEEAIRQFNPQGIILSGGPETVTVADTPRAPAVVFELGCPVLGICYGMQTMAAQLGGAVATAKQREFGYSQVTVQGQSELLAEIADHVGADGEILLDAWMSHGDHVEQLPPGFSVIASTSSVPIAGMADLQRHFYGLLFHIEVTHTRQGARILERFVRNICHCKPTWTPAKILQTAIADIQQRVGHEQVILGLSGGTDSAVTAALIHRAIGQQLHCVFVDTGLLRHDEGQNILQIFQHQYGMQVTKVDAQARFLQALAGVAEPEQKRKIIGAEFIKVFEEFAASVLNAKWLAQGTIYSDVIESGGAKSGKSHRIKSHHNVGGLPDNMQLKLLEPLRELFKDEVCRLGLELGLPSDLLYRHPFPGTGLAVRIMGEVKAEYLALLRHADDIFIEELHKAHWYQKVSQAFAVFLPVKSVGVIGDARQYADVIALRAIVTSDFMTATWAHLPYKLLEKVSNRIINEVHGISRVVYDVSGKPPATIEWE
jgi:GMP synthase (glutamine-hydrolysing)